MEISKKVDSLREGDVRRLLVSTAQISPLVACEAQALYDREVDRENNEAVNFDRFSKFAWHFLNTIYKGLSSSKQYDVSIPVEQEINNIVARTINCAPLKNGPEEASAGLLVMLEALFAE